MKIKLFHARNLRFRARTALFAATAISTMLVGTASAQSMTASPPLAPSEPSQEPEPLVTDRPDYTESTETVPTHLIQIEGGCTYTQSDRRDSAQSFGEMLVRVATGPKAEVRIGLNSYDVEHGPGTTAYGLEDADIGVKIRLREGAEDSGLRRPAVSLIALTSLPTGTGDERGDGFQPTVKMCLGFSLSRRLDLGVNANYSFVSDDTGHFSQFSPSASFGYTLTKRVGSFFEYYGLFPLRKQPTTHYFDTGLTYLVGSDTQLDLRIGTGLNGAADDGFMGAGASVRF